MPSMKLNQTQGASSHDQDTLITLQRKERQLYDVLQGSPRTRYPFPDLVNPHIDELDNEYKRWIEMDCQFQSEIARQKHRQHRLADIAARAFPWLDMAELRPVARFTAFLAIIDDYMDHSDRNETLKAKERVSALLIGTESRRPDPGFYHQIYLIRQDAMACYADEKKYNSSNVPPPLSVFQPLRRRTSGGLSYAKYLVMQKNYRELPDKVLLHPTILRMHDLVASIIGYHNDFISLPKELFREGDVVNLVIVVQHEYGLSLGDACRRALDIHGEDLAELIQLQGELPDFGEHQEKVVEYVADLGVMVQGVFSWHTESSGRYVPGAYVEPEHQT